MSEKNFDAPSKSYKKYRDLSPSTNLTLQEFVDLFNEDNENPFWDMFYLEADEDNVKLISRNYCVIS